MIDGLSPLGRTLVQGRRYRILELARGRADVIAMGRGDPDLPTPEHIVEAGRAALGGWGTHYTAPEGARRLREAIARKLWVDNGLRYAPDQILVTTGAQEALFLSMLCLLGPGDAAVISDPFYGAYQQMAAAAGARLIAVPARPDTMEPDVAALAATAPAEARVLVLVSPNNPSTNVAGRATLQALAALAVARDWVVVSDEIYEKLVFDGHRHDSIASLPGMPERTIVVNGFAKAYNMTGWRIGYAAGPRAIVDAMTRLKQAVSICAPAVAQAAAQAALEGPQNCVANLLATYARRRRVVLDALDAMGLPYVPHQGTFYVYVDVSASGLSSDAFAETLLLQGGVLALPSSEFGAGRRHLRLSLLQPEVVLEQAMARVATVWRAHPRGGA